MRTTLNIDDDLMIIMKERARSENKNLTRVVNELLRLSLAPAKKNHQPFRQKNYSLLSGANRGDNPAALSGLYDTLLIRA